MARILAFMSVLMPLALAVEPELPSARLQMLRASIKTNPKAVEQFWRDVQGSGTPMIEPAPEDPSKVLVTFLWRGPATLSNVVVFASVLPDNDPAKQRLTNLPGTDVWFRTFRFRRDLPIVYEISPRGPEGLQRDPLNPNFLDGPMGGSIAILPGVPNRAWSEAAPSLQGTMEKARFRSKDLKTERTLSLYRPASFTRGGEYDTLVVLDEDVYTGPVPLASILDQLIGTGAMRPTVAVLIGNTDRAAELSCSTAFSSFLADEILPFVETRLGFKRLRGRTTIMGSSLGGLAAACAGVYAPDRFGNVIAISASFRWRPKGDAEPEWLARYLATSPAVPVRFSIGVGSAETGTPDEPGSPSLLTASRHLRDILRAKNYRVDYREFPGAHEPLSWRFVIPDLLRQAQ